MKNERLIEEWLSYAASDFALANKGKFSKEVRYDSLCYHAQQAAEKAIKAVLIFYRKPFPKTHNIGHLLKLLKEKGIVVPKIVEKSQLLTEYAVDSCYPDDFFESEKVNKKEYEQAVKIADKVLKWAKLVIRQKPFNKLF